MDGGRVDREVATGDGGERRGEAVHVVEQVEGVRDPDEPDQGHDNRDDVVREQLDAEAACDHDRRRRELCYELRERTEMEDVVEQSGSEDQRAPGDDPEHLRRRLDHPGRRGCGDPRHEPAVDPDTSEGRRRRVVPAFAGGHRDQSLPEPRVQQQPDHEKCDGQGGDRDGRAHCHRVVPAPGRRRPSRRPVPLQSGGGRLRRPDPLPRAVREPLPARPTGEVQGLGARSRCGRSPCR